MPMPINDISSCLKEGQIMEVVNSMESNILRNQSPTAKFQSATEIGGSSQFGFLTSGQREQVQKTLFKIKSTGRKISDDQKKLVLDEAENQDNVMTNMYSVKDGIHQEFEVELRKSLIEFCKTLPPLFGKLKSQLIEQIIENVRGSYKSFEDSSVRRLQTNLSYGGKDLPEEEFERIIVSSATAELSSKGNQAFHSTVSIASDYLYEKIQDKLQDILFELTEAAANEANDEMKAQLQKSPSPKTTNATANPPKSGGSKLQPKVPPKIKKGPAPTPPKGKPSKGKEESSEEVVHVEALPKVEGNLNHATKDRAAVQQKRKPPSRKPRPSPPSQTAM